MTGPLVVLKGSPLFGMVNPCRAVCGLLDEAVGLAVWWSGQGFFGFEAWSSLLSLVAGRPLPLVDFPLPKHGIKFNILVVNEAAESRLC